MTPKMLSSSNIIKILDKKDDVNFFSILRENMKRFIFISIKVLDRLHAKEENCKNLQTEIEDQHRKVSVIRHQVKISLTLYTRIFCTKFLLPKFQTQKPAL